VKFKDADLLGMPLRIVVGAKGLKDGTAELRDRRTKKIERVPFDRLVAAVQAFAMASGESAASVSVSSS
jgi:prolyl-tRNA synthetase